MNKRSYRAHKVNQIKWSALSRKAAGQALVLATDVAKEEQYAVLMGSDRQSLVTVKWNHPEESGRLIEELQELDCELVVAMESTGVYGDTLREQFRGGGFAVHQVSAKRVSDAREIYDGVPSLHDPKAAYVIARLYWEGTSREWVESTPQQREMDGLGRAYRLYQKQHQQQQNRAEAALQRHWPELSAQLALDSASLEELLIEYATPQAVAAQAAAVRARLRQVSRGQLSGDKIEAIIAGARHSIGIQCVGGEVEYLRVLGQELRRCRQQIATWSARLAALTDADPQLHEMGKTVGRTTTALLLGARLDPREFANPASYRKAFGLNLKERSSGRFHGQLKLTKRGPGLARRDVYLAVLRLLQHDPWVQAWYQRQLRAHASQPKGKVLVALMRKLVMALWHVGRGEPFDARKLLNAGYALTD